MRRLGTQISLVLVFAFAATGWGSAVARNDDAALRTVHRQGRFSNGVGKGSPPGPSAIQRAFTSLVRHRKKGDFLALTSSEESAERLYGLCGLKHLNAPEYADVQHRLADDRGAASGSVGCIEVDDTVGGMLAHEYGKSGRTKFDMICSALVVR